MKHLTFLTLVSLTASSTQLFAHQHEIAECGSTPAPLLSVADIDGNGKVTYLDVIKIAKAKRSGNYYSIYDRDADGDLDRHDIILAAKDLGKSSTATDQQLAKIYDQVKVLQTVTNAEQLYSLGFEPITSSLSGHGVHWNNVSSDLPISGVNVPEDASSVKGFYYAKDAIPLFSDTSSETGLSTLDYPMPNGAWMLQRIQAFDGLPPKLFPDAHDESWHTHAGLCITLQDNGTGPQFVLDQQTSFMECQVIPSLRTVTTNGVEHNAWFNLWMLHAWVFDLNPKGVFANTHPCLDPHAPLESTINGDREVPPFFSHH